MASAGGSSATLEITVLAGWVPGQIVSVQDPTSPGKIIRVQIPPNAVPGAKIRFNNDASPYTGDAAPPPAPAPQPAAQAPAAQAPAAQAPAAKAPAPQPAPAAGPAPAAVRAPAAAGMMPMGRRKKPTDELVALITGTVKEAVERKQKELHVGKLKLGTEKMGKLDKRSVLEPGSCTASIAIPITAC